MAKLFTDAEIQRLRQLFKEGDSDNDGSVTTVEAANLVKKFGIELPDAQVQVLVKKVDSNKSGTIEFVEFMKFANFARIEEQSNAPAIKERSLPGRSVSPTGSGSPMQAKRALIKVIKGSVKDQQDLFSWGDPFVVVKIGIAERKTAVKKNQQNPVWNEEFVFGDVSGKDASNVVIQMWNWNTLSNSLIGTGTLNLIQYESNKQTVTIPILSDNGAEKGWVQIDVELKSGGEYMGTIRVVDGSVFERHDTIGWADPYVVLKIGGNQQKTTEKKNSKNPVWNEQFTFNGINKAEAGNVSLKMWDWEKVGEHDLIGGATLSLLPYLDNKQKVTVTFVNPDNKKKPEQGSATLEVFLETEPMVVRERELMLQHSLDDAQRLAREEEDNARRGAEEQALRAKEAELEKALAEAKKAKKDAEDAAAEAEKAKSAAEKEKEEGKLATQKALTELESAKAAAEKEKEEGKLATQKALAELENAKAAAEKEREEGKQATQKALAELENAKAAAEKEREEGKQATQKALAELENAKAAAEKEREEGKQATQKALAELENAKAAAEKEREEGKQATQKALTDLENAKGEAERAKAEAENAKSEAERALADANQAKEDAERAKAAADKAKEEYEKLKADAGKQTILVSVYGDVAFPTVSFKRVADDQ